MITEPMHGPEALAIFWIFFGFIAAGAVVHFAVPAMRPE